MTSGVQGAGAPAKGIGNLPGGLQGDWHWACITWGDVLPMPHPAFQKQPWLESLTGSALDGAPRLNQHTSVLASCLTTLPQPRSTSTTPSSYRIPPGSASPPGMDGVHAMLTKGQLHGRAHCSPAHNDPLQGLQAQPGLLAVQQQAGEHSGHPRRQRGFVLAYALLDASAVQLRPCMYFPPMG